MCKSRQGGGRAGRGGRSCFAEACTRKGARARVRGVGSLAGESARDCSGFEIARMSAEGACRRRYALAGHRPRDVARELNVVGKK